MNERKWTPGPWRSGNGYNSIVSDHPTGDDNADGDYNFSAYGGYLIAESVFSAENMGIIKAAPDLYEALEDLMVYQDMFSDDRLAAAYEALAKARGEK